MVALLTVAHLRKWLSKVFPKNFKSTTFSLFLALRQQLRVLKRLLKETNNSGIFFVYMYILKCRVYFLYISHLLHIWTFDFWIILLLDFTFSHLLDFWTFGFFIFPFWVSFSGGKIDSLQWKDRRNHFHEPHGTCLFQAAVGGCGSQPSENSGRTHQNATRPQFYYGQAPRYNFYFI